MILEGSASLGADEKHGFSRSQTYTARLLGWNPQRCAPGSLGIPVQGNSPGSWSQFPPISKICRHTPSPLFLLPHLIPGTSFSEVWEKTEVDSEQGLLTQYFRMDSPRVWRVAGPIPVYSTANRKRNWTESLSMLKGSQRECSAGIWLETRGQAWVPNKDGTSHLSGCQFSGQSAPPDCPFLSLNSSLQVPAVVPGFLQGSAGKRHLPHQSSWSPSILVTAKGAMSLPCVGAMSTLGQDYIPLSIHCLPSTHCRSPLCLGAGDRGSQADRTAASSFCSRSMSLWWWTYQWLPYFCSPFSWSVS